MIAATVNGQDCWIVPYGPNTDDPCVLSATIAIDTQRALTGPRSSRPQQQALRCNLSWASQITASDFATARNASQAAQDEPILMPAWPFAIAADGALAVTSGLTFAWTRDFSATAINPVSFAAYDFKAPLLYGRFDGPPRLTSRNGDHVLAEFSFLEDGPADYAITPPAGADTTVETVGGFAAAVFPFVPCEPAKPGLAIVDVDRTRNSPAGRIQSTVFYPQTPERMHEATFRFKTAAAAAQMLSWWARRAGGADPLWVSDGQRIGSLSADAAAGTDTLEFDSLVAHGTNHTLALTAGPVLEVVRGEVFAGTTVTTATNLANTWRAPWTVVTLALLARHTDEELELQFRRADDDWLAETTLTWREVSPEYTEPAGETRGTTLGRLPALWEGFQIDLDYNGAIETTRLTNWQSGGVNVGGEDWAYNDCALDKRIQSIDLQDDGTTFKYRYFAGCFSENWLPSRLAARGWLTYWRADVAADGTFSNFRQIWKGELGTPSRKGPNYSQKVRGANALFSIQAPRQKIATSCGTDLFTARCGLLRANWTFSANVTAIDGYSITLDTFARTAGGGLPAGFGFVNWFTLGYVEWTVDGVPYRAGIATSTVLAAGAITIAINRALGVALGASVNLVPGCDRQGATCRAYDLVSNPLGKFDNYTNFRGFENVPAIAPNFVVPPKQTSPAKK